MKWSLKAGFADGHVLAFEALVSVFVIFEAYESQAAFTCELLGCYGYLLFLDSFLAIVFLLLNAWLDFLISVFLCVETKLFENIVSPGDSTKWARDGLINLNFVTHPAFHALRMNVLSATKFTESQIFFFIHFIVTDAASLFRFKFHPGYGWLWRNISILRSFFFFLGFLFKMLRRCLSLSTMGVNSISIHFLRYQMIPPLQYFLDLRIQIPKLPDHRVISCNFEYFEQTKYCVHTMLIDSTSTAATNFWAYKYLILLLLLVLQG